MNTTVWIMVIVVTAAGAFLAGRAGGASRGESTAGAAPDVRPADADPDADEVTSSGAAGELRHDDPLVGRLSRAVDEIDLGVIVIDGDGTERFRNRAARRFSDARDGLVLVQAAVRDLLEAALDGATSRREVELYGPPAQSFVVTAHPFIEGTQSGALALVEDRSLEKRTETVRRDFVANISHELKTPIGALGLLAETILDEPDPEVAARLAERMIAEADRAACTVDDLLELSRIEFGDDAEFVDLDARSVIVEAAGRIASAADHAGVDVAIDVEPGLRLVGDRRQLVSALFNLLDNAVKYSRSGSEIVVAAVSSDDGTVLLTVSDQGIGIPRRDLDRVFERFYRVDRARSRGTGGTGLGLAIVRHVASNHGGRISVESIEGVGTTFTLTLPNDHDGPVGSTPQDRSSFRSTPAQGPARSIPPSHASIASPTPSPTAAAHPSIGEP